MSAYWEPGNERGLRLSKMGTACANSIPHIRQGKLLLIRTKREAHQSAGEKNTCKHHTYILSPESTTYDTIYTHFNAHMHAT